ncbi:MAG TPA: hypothetical protein VH112_14040 [Acidimicrobiales bacterium]|jgi:hypothetical protein|nr:hypothetical protein [Acidimicrobiales bacterium]
MIAVFVVALVLAQILGVLGLRRRGYELLCTVAMAVLLAIAIFAAARVLGLA